MTTKLVSPVRRSLGFTLQGREVTAGLELKEGKPSLTLRQKGYRSGWYVDLEDVSLFAAVYCPRAAEDVKVRVTKDKEKLDKWRKENEPGKSN